LPAGTTTSGTGISTTITELETGTYTFTVTSAEGCVSGPSTYVIINSAPPIPSAPLVGALAQPTCTVSTGGVMLTGLPSSGTWTLTRSPGGTITTGSGTSFAISNLTEGTYTYTVTNSVGCVSLPSGNVVISAQPTIPAAPGIGTITPPTCTLSTGSVQLTGLPSSGTWTLIRYPGTVTSGGTGSSVIISGLVTGSYNYTLTSAAGCVSLMSANVVIPSQPLTPSPPLIGTITQPHSGQLTGSVVLSGLPEPGTWTLRLYPGNINTSGTGAIHTISELSAGTYNFTVTNSAGCTSGLSASFEIKGSTESHVLVVTNPSPVCAPSTVDLTAPVITAGSSHDLTYTYWLDAAGTIPYYTPTSATSGIYYIKGSAADGFSGIKPVIATVYAIPHANAGPDQVLDHVFNATMNAKLDHNYETGLWSLLSGKGEIFNNSYPQTTVNGLSIGKNLFLWTVTNSVCIPASDSVMINVHDVALQSLITPNMDGKNDYFLLKRSDSDGRTELNIFDRRGVQVYKNGNYDNTWNGIDSNGKSLPDDTYFYVFRIGNGIPASGFIVVKR
jgi:gliding motility-associated-like protein